jgi:beta-N-acetylhexosaminidase
MVSRFKRCPLVVLALAIVPVVSAQAADATWNTPDGWKSLTLREKVGQTAILSSDLEAELKAGDGSLTTFFHRYPAAGLFLGSWKFTRDVDTERAAHIRTLVEGYRATSRIPLFIQEDYEQGPGASMPDYTELPMLMALGATDSPDMAAAYGRALALETRALGVNYLLNPVADLNINFQNPVVNSRSASDDPDRVIRLLSRQIESMQAAGVVTTIKHFPGDGLDFRDQHTVTTVNPLSLAEWHRTSGRVFKTLIEKGAPSVMVGHISFPAYQKERVGGSLLPATLSKEIVTNLLKGELGFKGVVISDALNMAGLQNYYPTFLETEIQSFKAGIDLLLWPDLAYFDELERRVKSGEVPMARLDDAVSRVWALKRRLGLLDAVYHGTADYSAEQHQASEKTATSVAEASLTLLRQAPGELPLRKEKTPKLLVVVVAPVSLAEARLKTFAPTVAALRQRGFEVDVRANLSFYDDGMTVAEGYDRILFAFDRHTHEPIGTMQLYEAEALTAYTANSLPRERVISISYGDPYVHDVALPRVATAINAYSHCPATQEAVVRALVGEIGFPGRSPVDLARLSKRLNP